MLHSFDFVAFPEGEWLRPLTSQPPRPNLLVVCDHLEMEPAAAKLMRWSAGSLHRCQLPGPLHLPVHKIDALMLRDVAALTFAQQIEVFDWMEGPGEGAQVISLTSHPLLPLVEDGRFLEGLFYRLNVVCVVTTGRRGSMNGFDHEVNGHVQSL